jgi:hypothetical protein
MSAKSKSNWEVIASLSDLPSARALATRLEAEGVAALVTSDTQLLGEARACDVRVPFEMAYIKFNDWPPYLMRDNTCRSSSDLGCSLVRLERNLRGIR